MHVKLQVSALSRAARGKGDGISGWQPFRLNIPALVERQASLDGPGPPRAAKCPCCRSRWLGPPPSGHPGTGSALPWKIAAGRSCQALSRYDLSEQVAEDPRTFRTRCRSTYRPRQYWANVPPLRSEKALRSPSGSRWKKGGLATQYQCRCRDDRAGGHCVNKPAHVPPSARGVHPFLGPAVPPCNRLGPLSLCRPAPWNRHPPA